ncbi:unnamed protein product, partial [Tetraodon nigroviridis]
IKAGGGAFWGVGGVRPGVRGGPVASAAPGPGGAAGPRLCAGAPPPPLMLRR